MIERTYFAPQPITDLYLKQTALINTIPFVFKTRYIYKNYWKQFYIDFRLLATKKQNIILEIIKLDSNKCTLPIKVKVFKINRLKSVLSELN